MDRFLMRISMGSMSEEEERRMIDRYITDQPLYTIEPVCTLGEIAALQQECRNIYVHADLRDYIVHLVQGTRNTALPPEKCAALQRVSVPEVHSPCSVHLKDMLWYRDGISLFLRTSRRLLSRYLHTE